MLVSSVQGLALHELFLHGVSPPKSVVQRSKSDLDKWDFFHHRAIGSLLTAMPNIGPAHERLWSRAGDEMDLIWHGSGSVSRSRATAHLALARIMNHRPFDFLRHHNLRENG